jgi:mono/diheme cytochrome c family protein
MRRVVLAVVAIIFLITAVLPHGQAADARQSVGLTLHSGRSSPADLEIAGDLPALPSGSTRYLTRDDLLALPQVHYTITDDANFPTPAMVSGVSLEELVRRLGLAPESKLVIAVCNDKYRAHYSDAYVATHHPLLVLQVNGRPPEEWPKDPEGNDMGPYLISHPNFTPSFKILSHADEAQIPWGVVRLEFRNQDTVFRSIAPHGPHANDAAVQAGFRIAQQNCLRCHNMGNEGGQKAGLSWAALGALAAASPKTFGAYVRNPRAANPRTQMAGSPNYDDVTLAALEAYFQTFSR